MKPIVRLLVVFPLLLAGCGDRSAKPPPEAGSGIADDDVTTVILSWEDTLELIAGYKDRVVVVDLWSTHCDPCMREFPNLVELHNKYGSGKVACISVSCDYQGLDDEPPEFYRSQVLKFLRGQNATFDNIILNVADIDFYQQIKLAAIPSVQVYDRQGKLVQRFDNDAGEYGDEGFTYKKHITPLVESLLNEEGE